MPIFNIWQKQCAWQDVPEDFHLQTQIPCHTDCIETSVPTPLLRRADTLILADLCHSFVETYFKSDIPKLVSGKCSKDILVRTKLRSMCCENHWGKGLPNEPPNVATMWRDLYQTMYSSFSQIWFMVHIICQP